ncbi:MAG: hypothetical protein VX871_10890, partial [Pseudomonadota bacterium]|nr:hypothetical protein [Pseudomonadota bacterium]
IAFLILGNGAAGMWIDGGGLTPLTARLFASPLVGLGLGLFLCSRASDWRQVAIPACGMIAFGVAVTLAIALNASSFVLPGPMAWVVAATPVLLFLTGLWILWTRPAGLRLR